MNPIIAVRTLLLACLAALCLGCGHSFQWEGKWVGDRGYKAKPGEDPSVAHTLSKVELTIQNGHYDLFEGGIPRKGKVAVEEGGLMLSKDNVLSQNAAPQPDGLVRAINTDTIEFKGMGMDPAAVRLKRETQR